MHREFADDRLARAGRGSDQYAMAGLERAAGLELEVVEGEVVESPEGGQ